MTVPYDRIAAQDFYRQLDWIRDEWSDRDEYVMTQKLQRLDRLFGRLPTRYYDRALPLLTDLGWCRIVAGRDHHYFLRALAEIVREWDGVRRARAA